jgi:hypothetical protein
MAQRDRSQGFGFMYVDISKILKQRDELAKSEMTPVSTNNVMTANFNKDRKIETPVTAEVPPTVPYDKAQAIQQIKNNLDRLQTLHHKLHAMLAELNKISDKKTKTN